nr:segregation/condensation protein A [Lentilactobacillus kosonis]
MVTVDEQPASLLEPSPFNRLDLMAAFVDALKRLRYNQPMSTVVHEWKYTIESQTEAIRQIMGHSSSITFNELTELAATSEEVITDFLAILEMAKYQEIKLSQTNRSDPIKITKGDV